MAVEVATRPDLLCTPCGKAAPDIRHTGNYEIVSEPFIEYIPHLSGHNNCLIVRVCWKMSDTEFVPMSFVCITGAPLGLYLSTRAAKLLRSIKRLVEDETGNEYVDVCGVGKVSAVPTPPGHGPLNILGLRALMSLGLNVDSGTFRFNNEPEAW